MKLRALLFGCICLEICIEINSLKLKDTSLSPIISVVASSNLHNPAKDESSTNHSLFNPSVSVSSQSIVLNSASNNILNQIDDDDYNNDVAVPNSFIYRRKKSDPASKIIYSARKAFMEILTNAQSGKERDLNIAQAAGQVARWTPARHQEVKETVEDEYTSVYMNLRKKFKFLFRNIQNIAQQLTSSKWSKKFKNEKWTLCGKIINRGLAEIKASVGIIFKQVECNIMEYDRKDIKQGIKHFGSWIKEKPVDDFFEETNIRKPIANIFTPTLANIAEQDLDRNGWWCWGSLISSKKKPKGSSLADIRARGLAHENYSAVLNALKVGKDQEVIQAIKDESSSVVKEVRKKLKAMDDHIESIFNLTSIFSLIDTNDEDLKYQS